MNSSSDLQLQQAIALTLDPSSMGSSLKHLPAASVNYGRGPSLYTLPWGSCTSRRPLCQSLRQCHESKSSTVFWANCSTVYIHKTRVPRSRKTRNCALTPQHHSSLQPFPKTPGGASGNPQQASPQTRDQANLDLLVSLSQQFARESFPWIQVRALSLESYDKV